MSNTGMNAVLKSALDKYIQDMEQHMDRDILAVFGPITYGMEQRTRDAITDIHGPSRRNGLAVILDTPGGVVEVVERMVNVIRHFYEDVRFIIPDRAMSAGTIFAMSGDSICMDYYSVLGPIDPQVVKDGKLVPALSYLVQFERLIKKDLDGKLSSAEYALLSKLDLAELHQYEQARELTMTLLRRWLSRYKFKNWDVTKTTGRPVTPEMREDRARSIGEVLSDNERWNSHGRGISRETLESDEIKLRIDNLDEDRHLQRLVREYHHCLMDWMATLNVSNLVQSRAYF